VARLAVRMRRGEELLATRTLAALGVPILRTIHGTGLVEGGSFAWIDSKHAVVGRSIRVNDEGIAQVADVLAHQGVELIVADMSGYSIHIDGAFLMVDADLALVDATQLPYSFLRKLEELRIRTIEITPEDDGWIINALAVRPGRVLAPPGASDRTREALEKNKVQIVELPYDKMHHNGGGIHCSTCPLIRDSLD
jgi:N-dimethylarginine dimethylaminohydrolase